MAARRRFGPGRALARSMALLALLGTVPLHAGLSPVEPAGPAPDLALKDFEGQPLDPAGLRGRVLLINFWATWCPPCVAEMPALDRLQAARSGQAFRVIAVSKQEHLRRLRHFRQRLGLDAMTFVHDPDGAVSADWGVDFLPASFLLDRRGRIRYHALGEVDWDDARIRSLIDALLREPASGPTP